MHTRGQNLGASPTFIVHRKKASQRVSKTCVFKDVFIYFSLGLMLTMNQKTLCLSHLKTVSKDFTHRVTFYNWIHFEIIFHPTPNGNLQEEKPLNSGVKTKGAFGHSRPCVCILRVAAISLHFFFLLYSIVIQTEGHAKEALLLTPQPYKILLIFCSPRAPRFVPLWSPFHVYYSQSFLMKRTYRLLTLTNVALFMQLEKLE